MSTEPPFASLRANGLRLAEGDLECLEGGQHYINDLALLRAKETGEAQSVTCRKCGVTLVIEKA